MKPSFQKVFMEEAQELFIALENDLISLDSFPDNKDLINKIFRELHTLKGSGAMFGFSRLSEFAHHLEALFDLIRNDKLAVNQEIISISLEFLDYLKILCDDTNQNIDSQREISLLNSINTFLPKATESGGHTPEQHETNPNSKKRKVYRLYFKPDQSIFTKGINPVVIFKNLEALGELFCFTHEEAIPPIDKINPELCYTFWTCILITEASIDEIKDVFIFVEGSCELTISVIYDDLNKTSEITSPVIGNILLSKGDITEEAIQAILDSRKLFGERAVEMGFTSNEKVASALFEQNTIKKISSEIQSQSATTSIRVQNEKLDILTNAVSELVTLQARLTQYSGAQKDMELTTISEYLEKLTSSLRDTVMMIRMIPIEEGFASMHRLVRDVSRDVQKKVKLTIVGGDTELDKAVIDNLKDPIMHCIRNSIDHGIESREERLALGKDETGHITIKAEHLGSHVFISLIDDGKGFDKEKIYDKAIEKGIVSTTDTLSESDIFNLVFIPGFSTAEKTTNISGRGVGMDVVKRNIESIRGEVFIESKKNVGTTIKMKLPINLAIIDGLLFTVGEELFVVNIATVSECIELTSEIKKAAGGQNILKLRDSLIPYVYLRSLLNIPGESPEHEQIIIMNTHEQVIGFVVDSVQGKHQTVVKSTSRLFANVKDVTGATILGDGRIALILDVNNLSKRADKNRRKVEDESNTIVNTTTF